MLSLCENTFIEQCSSHRPEATDSKGVVGAFLWDTIISSSQKPQGKSLSVLKFCVNNLAIRTHRMSLFSTPSLFADIKLRFALARFATWCQGKNSVGALQHWESYFINQVLQGSDMCHLVVVRWLFSFSLSWLKKQRCEPRARYQLFTSDICSFEVRTHNHRWIAVFASNLFRTRDVCIFVNYTKQWGIGVFVWFLEIALLLSRALRAEDIFKYNLSEFKEAMHLPAKSPTRQWVS